MISFILNDDNIDTGLPLGTTVLDFVRYQRHLKGTKIGCREGDCGACVLMVGELKENEVRYQIVTSCLMPLSAAHGKHIVTIEGINPKDGSLTPVQQAMVDHNGTQCGFCTVGFVMSLTNYCINKKSDAPEEAVTAIEGNICRCTGYKSIERAAHQLTQVFNTRDGLEPMSFAIEKGVVPKYFSAIPTRLKEIAGIPLPVSLLKKIIVAGGTDVYVQHGETLPDQEVTSLLYDPALKFIREADGRIELGGSVTVTDMLESLVMVGIFPNLKKHIRLISSTPIRNMATIAGNIANASPIGDLTIWFLALNATVVVRNGTTREIPLKDFFEGYKVLATSSDEIIEKIYFQKPTASSFFNLEKVSKRTSLDIASVNSAIYLETDDHVIREAHLSAGGVAPIPLLLKNTSACLKGKTFPLSESDLKELDYIMESEIAPISDVRGTAIYKRILLRQLFHAHLHQLMQRS